MLCYTRADSGLIALIEMNLILTENIWRTSRGLMLTMGTLHIFLTCPILLASSLPIAQLILVNVDILIQIDLSSILDVAKDSNLLWLHHASL